MLERQQTNTVKDSIFKELVDHFFYVVKHMHLELFVMLTHYPFNACTVCSDTLFLIPEMGNLCLFQKTTFHFLDFL